jgi:hypothetical protein
MDSGILNALFRDPVLNRLAVSEAATGKPALPESVVARVTAMKGDLAMLRWQGGNFSASLNAAVTPGETLLLKYNGVKEGRSHYRIMARFPVGADQAQGPARETGEPFLFGLMPAETNKKHSTPALVRFMPDQGKKNEAYDSREPLLEIFLDTENFGLVLIQFFFLQKDRLECQFVVESPEAGKALQSEAERLIAEAGGGNRNQSNEPLRWSVGNLRRTISEVLAQGGLNLNKRV